MALKRKKSLLITFEGGEGSGKSKQVELFYPWFKCVYDSEAVVSREPGGDLVGERIRELLLNPEYKGMNPWSELFLFEAARASFYGNIVIPSLNSGKSVVLDRSLDSTTAYQAYGRKLDFETIRRVNHFSINERYPDLTFVINVDPEVGLANRSKSGGVNRIDMENLEFHRRVNQGYVQIVMDGSPRFVLIPYVDGINKVQESIRKEFSERYLS
ncbi:dTMP kinase [Candidatus Pacearchaeota archaeon CG10_big_fil_rev_8_21_14_0_10_31_9]|nr:MAG: dTMP kinase [Candidatus Pacearchaeota archaeon CG1_02_32_21]PIN94491.1 MAG: dTMP kinase [Candidatus Pacearchaeota archaeon CG10_big_fil_rev_8_21_14_0_10_31_9]PIZ83820.1 MAG: dTMP kinase [Candidatus Pacearchaeota archaeon CG_4_10_14_0_2_um_filter_05_32_18]